MMQETQTIGTKGVGQERRVSRKGFAVLFALARGSLTTEELRVSLRVDREELEQTLERFKVDGMVICSSAGRGTRVERIIRMTDQGELILLRELEQMCELPER